MKTVEKNDYVARVVRVTQEFDTIYGMPRWRVEFDNGIVLTRGTDPEIRVGDKVQMTVTLLGDDGEGG